MLGYLSIILKVVMTCAILHNFVIDDDGHNEHLQYSPDGNNHLDYILFVMLQLGWCTYQLFPTLMIKKLKLISRHLQSRRL